MNPNPVIKIDNERASEIGKKKRGVKHKSTLIKEALGVENIVDLKSEVLRVWAEFIKGKDKKMKILAAKEISKYLFPQKRELSGELSSNINANQNVYVIPAFKEVVALPVKIAQGEGKKTFPIL